MIDTHAHLYLPEFQDDLNKVLNRAQAADIEEIWLAATDSASILEIERIRPLYRFRCFAGLHPCDVKANYQQELQAIRQIINTGIYDGIGEIGLDLYWDKTFRLEQEQALSTQLDWALELEKPVILHVREAYQEILPIIRPYFKKGLKGIFHSFSGTPEQAAEIVEAGFLLGINGVVTFKKSNLPELLKNIPLQAIVTETDSPYLTPTPHRGKRNESSYIPLIVDKLGEIYKLPAAEIATVTTQNARKLLAHQPS
jgi:TatD DNase family protein